MKKSIIFVILVLFAIIIFSLVIKINNNKKSEKTEESRVNDDNIKNENVSEELENMLDMPLPNEIVFYHDGIAHNFSHGTEEYKNIIKLNNLRKKGELLETYGLVVTGEIDKLKKDIDLLEYKCENFGTVYFNLENNYVVTLRHINFPNDNYEERAVAKNFWIIIEYDNKETPTYVCDGLADAKELVEYLKKVIV